MNNGDYHITQRLYNAIQFPWGNGLNGSINGNGSLPINMKGNFLWDILYE